MVDSTQASVHGLPHGVRQSLPCTGVGHRSDGFQFPGSQQSQCHGNTGYTNPIKWGDPVVASLDPKWPPQAQFRQGVTIPPVETRGHLLVHAKGLHYPYI